MRDIHHDITQKIIAKLKQGVVPWRRPWSQQATGGVFPRNAVTGNGYSGMNVLSLMIEAEEKGYDRPLWLTYKQATGIGAQVRKGEHGCQVIYLSTYIAKGREPDEDPRRIGFLKTYTVFNVAQCDNVPEKYAGVREPVSRNKGERVAEADEFVATSGAVIRHGGSRAFFSPTTDHIQMPVFEGFKNADTYYGVLFHELTHWTGTKERCDRNFSAHRFGDEGYSGEELVAELGAAFMCAEFGFDRDDLDASYIASWIKFLGEHEQALVSAASMASKAVDFLRQKALAEPELEAA